MLLKSIELQGYKTFAGRTAFEFAGAITCIVGPNGSGKSNIGDAIRWVLGEQSYRLLRGKKTEDMIFSGSESRPRAGMATANIIFDNATGWLPLDFTEVSIARRAYRDGSNEYLINGQRVRLKDIAELLGNSGLSERTYTIIGQGLVDAALTLRAEERRRLFEEAAGIGLYRSRRQESQKRLDTTRRNLERVEDILAELKPRLRSLERQARRAEQYEQVHTDLKVLLRDYYGYHWYQAQREVNEAREDAQVQNDLYEAVRQEQAELDQKLSTFRENIQGLRARLGSWHRESSQLHTHRESITRELAVSDERVRSIMDQQLNAKDELARLDHQIKIYQERLAETDQSHERLNAELAEAREQVKAATIALNTRQSERLNVERTIRKTRQKLDELNSRQNRLQARVTERKTQLDRQHEALLAAEEAVNNADQELKKVETRLHTADEARQKISAARLAAETTLESHLETLTETENEHQLQVAARTEKRTDLTRLQAQLEVLEQAEKALTGYASGTRVLLKSAQDGRLKGTQGALSAQLEVPAEYEAALAAVLGDYLDAVLLDESGAADDALEILVGEASRGALLPLNALTPPEPLKVTAQNGVIGVAAEMVKVPPELRPAVDLLLGHTILVEHRTAARTVLTGQPLTARAVTLQGEVFYATGPISAGQSGGASTLSRPRQRRELQEQIGVVERQISDLDETIAALVTELKNLKADEKDLAQAVNDARRQERAANDSFNQISLDFDRVQRQTQWQRDQHAKLGTEIHSGEAETRQMSGQLNELETEINQNRTNLRNQQNQLTDLPLLDFQSQVSHWNTQVAVAKQSLENAQTQRKEREIALRDVKQTQTQLSARLGTFETALGELENKKVELRQQENEIVAQIEGFRVLIEPAEVELENSEKGQDELQKTEAQARHGLSMADRRHSQAQLNLTRKQELLDNWRERIEEDLGLVTLEYAEEISGPQPLPLGEIAEPLKMVTVLPAGLEQTIKRQRAQVRRMGSINPEAQSEFKEVKERFEFMTTQVEDLKNAEKDILEVIAELEVLMEREFRKTFDLVAAEFREIFTRLFGGGSARLVLTDPNDMTETGIDIEARLPGRRTQGLSLLSGGERSLTATALVFSLLKVSPTPFCVLDEVDAMLDEANVGRFRDLLRELAENTQFIVITHNRNTVQAADVIYGVTMGRDSASQMISLKLDEVADIVKN